MRIYELSFYDNRIDQYVPVKYVMDTKDTLERMNGSEMVEKDGFIYFTFTLFKGIVSKYRLKVIEVEE
jgi:hypothetical protein